MGQSSSQLAAPSQQIEIKRTPTPDLSDIDESKSARGPAEPTSVMGTPNLEKEHITRRWSPINARKTSVEQAAAQAISAPLPPPATTSRSKVTKKRASDSTQRRLRSPQTSKVVAPGDSSDEEQWSSQRPRKALPRAARDEGDAPVLQATSVKRDVFSPLRKTKVQTKAPKSPTPVHSPPPRVIIPSSEIAAATQAQALEHHVEAIQQQLSRAQSLLQSPARPSAPSSRLTSPLKPVANPLSAVQDATEGNDWFSKIDAAVDEVAANRRTAVGEDSLSGSKVTGKDRIMGREKKGHRAQSALAALRTKRSYVGAEVDLTHGEPGLDSDVAGHDKAKDETGVEEGAPNEMEEEAADEADRVDADIEKFQDDGDWPMPTGAEIEEHLKQRPLTADDLEFEAPIEEPKSAWDMRENARRTARNVLREHIVKWNLERKVYKGLAKYVLGEDGEPAIVYAEPGETFSLGKHSKAERREAKAKKESMTSIRTALHESIVGSELELRKIAMTDDARRSPLEAHAEDAETAAAEAFIATQSPSLAKDAVLAGKPVQDVKGFEMLDPGKSHNPSKGAMLTADLDDNPDIVPAAASRTVVPSPTSKSQRPPKPKKGKGLRTSDTEQSRLADDEKLARTAASTLLERQRQGPKASESTSIGQAVPNAPIPTPPKSDENGAEPFIVPSQPASAQVDDWLASQSEEHAIPEPSAAKTSRKRKRKSSANDEADFEDVAPEDSNSVTTSTRAEMQMARKSSLAAVRRSDGAIDSEAPKAKKRRSNSEASGEPSKPKRTVTMSGPFTQEERELADKIFDNVLQKEGLRESELMAHIQNWKTCGTFKTDMFAAFSDRSVESVRKFCQRRWHGQQRGPWTPDQDEALQRAYASQPGKWTVISDSVGRTAGDCKDRWRRRFESDHISSGPWTVEEEEQLVAAVEECIKVIKKENRGDPDLLKDRERLEALINWRVVFDKLDGKRSTVRCREKYLKIRAAQDKEKNHDVSWRATPRAKGGDEPQKVAMARRKVAEFEIGDFYDVFVEIHSSFQDPHQHFRDEKHVVWSIVAAKNPDSRFSMFSYSSSMRRVALENAIETWPANNAKIKKKLEKVDTVPAKALVLAKWIEKTYAGRLDTIARTYQPDFIGKSKEELRAVKQARREKFSQGPRKSNGKSKDYVTDSEEEDDAPESASDSSVGQAKIPAAVLGEGSDALGNKDDEESAEEDDAERSDASLNVPASQFQEENDTTMTDVESLKGTPSIGPANFVDRLKSSGGSARRTAVGYGRKDQAKAARRRSHAAKHEPR